MPSKKLLLRGIKALRRRIKGQPGYPVRLRSRSKLIRGHVLFSYLTFPLGMAADADKVQKHTAYGRCKAIAGILTELGYEVDAINWNDQQFIPKRHYDLVFDICLNLARWEPFLDPNTIKLLYITGSGVEYQNAAELARVDAVNRRRNGNYQAKRLVPQPQLAIRSVEIADTCLLLGNEFTLQTFPEAVRNKMILIPTGVPPLGAHIKQPCEFVPAQREFLWFAGAGAVHKGLDLLLEVFARNPGLTLHVVGNVAAESDFMEMYAHELTELPNIHYHGFLNPQSDIFNTILATTFSLVAPTCCEGISSAVAHALRTGLYPIISRDTGVTLPENCGIYLEQCSIEEIEQAVLTAYHMNTADLTMQISRTLAMAQIDFANDNWIEAMRIRITDVLNG